MEEGGSKGRSWFRFRRLWEGGWRMVWRELLDAKMRGASKVPIHSATHLGSGGGSCIVFWAAHQTFLASV